jgi:hypothetical protein
MSLGLDGRRFLRVEGGLVFFIEISFFIADDTFSRNRLFGCLNELPECALLPPNKQRAEPSLL